MNEWLPSRPRAIARIHQTKLSQTARPMIPALGLGSEVRVVQMPSHRQESSSACEPKELPICRTVRAQIAEGISDEMTH